MKEFKNKLNEEEKELNLLLKKIKTNKIDIEGYLRINFKGKNKSIKQYIHVKEKIPRYIPKSNIHIAKLLAQKSYNTKIEYLINKRLSAIRNIKRYLDIPSLDDFFYELSPEKQELVIPIKSTPEQILQNWKNKPFLSNQYYTSNKDFSTKNGEKVRSKSEKILADLFYDQNITYKYECPLNLNKTTIYPDFTFLNPISNQEIYWEHFGRMDDPQYAEKAINKINLYLNNNIFLNNQLVITFETTKNPLSKETLEKHLNYLKIMIK